MYPKERGRTAGRAYISFVGTNTTINLFIPCNIIATCGMWEHRQKMRFTVRAWYRFRDGGASSGFKGAYWRMQYKVEPGNYLPLRAYIPKPLTNTVAFVRDEELTFPTGQ